VEKLLLYIEVHQLRKKGFKISSIARKLGICRNTVYKYLEMPFEEATEKGHGDRYIGPVK
jgi:transposase